LRRHVFKAALNVFVASPAAAVLSGSAARPRQQYRIWCGASAAFADKFKPTSGSGGTEATQPAEHHRDFTGEFTMLQTIGGTSRTP
jgi:hypothetical protein